MGEGGEDLRPIWPRRRFLTAAAAAGLAAVAGAPHRFAGSEEPGRPAARVAGRPASEPSALRFDHLPIHGSPRLLATSLPASLTSMGWVRGDLRLIHFHLPRGERERLLFPFP